MKRKLIYQCVCVCVSPSFPPFCFQLVRFPTPFRKDLKTIKAKRKKGKYKPKATPSTTIFRKGSSCKDDFVGPTHFTNSVSTDLDNPVGLKTPLDNGPLPSSTEIGNSLESLGDLNVWVKFYHVLSCDWHVRFMQPFSCRWSLLLPQIMHAQC